MLSSTRDALFSIFKSNMEGRVSPYQLEDTYAWTEEDYLYEDELSSRLEDVLDEGGLRYGASKLVLKFDYCPNWVFKIPFQGETYLGYDEDTDMENATFYSWFNNVGRGLSIDCEFDRDEWDYCHVESKITEYIEKEHPELKDMFAKTYYIGDYGVPIYASERCDGDWDSEFQVVKQSAAYKTLSSSYHSSWRGGLDVSQQISLILSHGFKKANLLFDFLTETGISDLHYSNLAYDDAGRVRIIDYSVYLCNY